MSDSEDDFVTYGNALEPLDEENLPRKKPAIIEDQIACDAQGRRRFHGAFTGGFSAGYFNTVGTRDGWRPQQFKSTRSNKASNVVQRPEDFMDEEDTGEFGIAPTAIRATQDYSDEIHKGKKRELAKHSSTGPIPGTPVLNELLKSIRERVGVILLKKMGWKPGQGIGPRLTKQEKKQKRKQQEKKKIYGCALPNQQEKISETESESSDDEHANITFAPDDYEPFRCNPKDNYFGIGYSGLDRRPILTEHLNLFDAPTFNVQDKNKKLSIKGQAFGVGAFETEDDDIYAKEDMSRYDFALGPERKSKSRWSKEEKPKIDCIEGFVPAKEQFPQKKVFPAPILPKDYQPIHKIRKSRFSPLEKESEPPKRHEMNAESRAKIINDDRPSIIDSKNKETKNSVAVQLITNTLNLHGKEQTAERQKWEQTIPKKSSMSWLDKLSSNTFIKGESISSDPKIQGSLQDINTFMKDKTEINEKESGKKVDLVTPKFADLDKQCRFEQYLAFSDSEKKLKFASIQPLSMTDWERDQEIEEFEKAARLCERIKKLSAGENEEKKETDKKIDLESLNSEDRMTAAAKMKMFGKLTRTVTEWKPAKLVCVRFNIAEPSVGVAEVTEKKKKFSIFDSIAWNDVSKFEKGKHENSESESLPSTSNISYSNKNIEHKNENDMKILSNEGTFESVTEKEKIFQESYEKIFGKNEITESKQSETKLNESQESITKNNIQEKKDLYQSIFLSSSDESESDTENVEAIDEEKLKIALIGKSAAEQNVERNTSPPRGIFAKLDLDSLLKRPEKLEISKEKFEDESESIDKNEKIDSPIEMVTKQDEVSIDQDLPPDAYGPALPKELPQASEFLSQKPLYTGLTKKSTLQDGIWVEKSKNKKKSKKEKKKHKHKERSRSKSQKKSKKDKKH